MSCMENVSRFLLNISLTISLNWAGMVLGPQPVGLSWMKGGSNLALIPLIALSEKFQITLNQSQNKHFFLFQMSHVWYPAH